MAKRRHKTGEDVTKFATGDQSAATVEHDDGWRWTIAGPAREVSRQSELILRILEVNERFR